MTTLYNKQNLYIRKLNGLGQKIMVDDSLKIKQLKEIIRSLKSLQTSGLKEKDFNLIFKGRNITERSENTLRELCIPPDGIVHLVFVEEEHVEKPCLTKPLKSSLSHPQQSHTQQSHPSQPQPQDQTLNQSNPTTPPIFPSPLPPFPLISITHPPPIILRVIFNSTQHTFPTPLSITVLQLKKKIATKLNLVYQSLVLSHLGEEMRNHEHLTGYGLEDGTLVSVRFINMQTGGDNQQEHSSNSNSSSNKAHHIKQDKKKLQSRMVSSVTFSDQNNEPNTGNPNTNNTHHLHQQQHHPKSKLASSSFQPLTSDKQPSSSLQQGPTRLLSLLNSNNNNTRTTMYKSDINTLSTSHGASKAALMFKNALHQKIIETQSVVSGSFSQDTQLSPSDPNSLMITVKNEQETKEFLFECQKSHQVVNIREKVLWLEKVGNEEKVEISMEEDLFQSIDLNKSGCVTLGEIVKRMGRERAVFLYRIV